MLFDSNGLPKMSGVSDNMDSAFTAGILATFDETFNKNICLKYVTSPGICVRHLNENVANNPNNFSRDQLVPLISGLAALEADDICYDILIACQKRGWLAQNTEEDIVGSKKKWPSGADWLSPSARNHLRICAGEAPSLIGKAWLVVDILYASYIDKKHEVNQLLCMCAIAGPVYLKLLKTLKKDLEQNIRDYYCGWRNEPELAETIINYINK